MDFNFTSDNESEASSEFSLEDSRELVAELQRATRGTSQSALYEFASLVWQVMDLHEQNGGDHDTAEFIGTSLQEIRAVVGADESSSDRMETLRGQAIDRWGDQLTPSEDVDLEGATADYGGWGDSDSDIPAPEADADVVAPSAEEISSLLTQLGGAPGRRRAFPVVLGSGRYR